MTWSSTRSVIGLVIALSIPASLPDGRPFPERDLILVVSALMILGSVLLQGLTLRAVVVGASLRAESEQAREAEEARRAMAAAAAAPSREHVNSFDAARQALLRLREQNRIGDEVLISMLREADLASRAAEGNALPGAGPPNP
jgi:CPA1 family monovalent cation:H+ antiporter